MDLLKNPKITSNEEIRIKSTNITRAKSDIDDDNLESDIDKFYFQEDIYNQLKIAYHQNILKFEQQFNTGQLALINNLNDTEVKEILNQVDTYLNLCFNYIKENDTIFNVTMKNNTNINHSKKNSNKKSDASTISLPKIKTNFNTCNNDIINIASVIPFDLIHYGLRSGSLQTANKSPTNKEPMKGVRKGATVTIDPNPSFMEFETSSTFSNINEKPDSRKYLKVQQENQAKNVIVLKYLVLLEFNKNYFTTSNSISDSNLFNVKLHRKPPTWSFNDYDSFTINLDGKNNTDSHLKSSSWSSSYNRQDETNKKRFVNSKAIVDRLYKYFQLVLANWPLKSEQVKFSISSDSMTKTCQQEKNQIKINMKWKGNKIKELDIVVCINIAIKYSNPNIDKNLNTSVKAIIKNFLSSSGCWFLDNSNFLVTDDVLDLLIHYSEKIYNLDLKTAYLSADSGIHCWSMNLIPMKLNLLKYLCCLSSLSTNNLGLNNLNLLLNLFNITLNDLNNNTNSSNNIRSANTTSTKVGTGIIITNNNSNLILNNNSTLFLVIKIIQIIKHIGFSWNGLQNRFDSELQNEEDLIANLAFNEINKGVNQSAWSSQNLFDRLWGILIDLRNSVCNLQMPDQFHVLNNILPKSWVNYIGFYTLPLLNSKTSIYDLNNYTNNSRKDEILSAIESGMKYLLTNVCFDERDFTVFNYANDVSSKEMDSMSFVSSSESHFRTNTGNNKLLKRKHHDTEALFGISSFTKSSIFHT